MENTKKMITCFCGFKSPEGAKFCSECGASLADIENIVPLNGGIGFNNPISTANTVNPIGVAVSHTAHTEERTPNPPDDKNLTLLIDCCRKTLATGCGDSFEETVLYLDEKTGEYQIHTYYRGFGSYNELHRGYKTDKQAYDKAMNVIIKNGLPDCDGQIGTPMCGGEYVCKFLYEGKVIRLTSSNSPQADLYSVGSTLNSFIKKENEIFGKTDNK